MERKVYHNTNLMWADYEAGKLKIGDTAIICKRGSVKIYKPDWIEKNGFLDLNGFKPCASITT